MVILKQKINYYDIMKTITYKYFTIHIIHFALGDDGGVVGASAIDDLIA